QGVATMENIIEEIAATLKRDALEIRRANCYGVEVRNMTPYGEVVENNTLPRLFTELEARCDYGSRMRAVHAFNASSPTHLKGLSMTAVKFGISFNMKSQPGERTSERLPRRKRTGLDRCDRDGPGRKHENQTDRRGCAARAARTRDRDDHFDGEEQQHVGHRRLE